MRILIEQILRFFSQNEGKTDKMKKTAFDVCGYAPLL